MGCPILAARSLELAESLMQAGTVPVAGTKEDQDQQQQEAEEQAHGQGAGGFERSHAVGRCPALLTVAVPAAVTDPMAMAFASTFLCSQEIHGLAPMVNAHQARATGSAR